MKSVLCFLMVSCGGFSIVPAADANADGLFAKLDRNADGKITREEISDSQKSMFRRALRVADSNDDSALSRDEFAKAVTDPKPVELPGANIAGRGASFDTTSLDRNRDGELTIDEIPAPLKERFQQILDRIKQDRVPVDKLQDYLRGGSPDSRGRPPGADEMMESEMPRSKETSGIEPKPESGKSPDRNGKNKGSGKSRMMENTDAGAAFRQLDRNADGKLSGDEIPPRLRENLKLADADDDGSLDIQELQTAFQRRMQNQKK